MIADVLFTGGPMFVGAGRPLDAHSVAVIGERIAAVIPDSAAGTYVGAGTRVIDLQGSLLAPGFQDAHIHPVGGGHGDAAVQPHRRRRMPRHRRPRRTTTRQPTPTSSGSSAAAGRWTTSRAARRLRGLLEPSCPTGPFCSEPRPPQHVGEHGGDPARRHRRLDARPGRTGGSSAKPTAPGRHVPRRRRVNCSPASGPAHSEELAYRGLLAAQASWSRSASPGGRTPWSAPSSGDRRPARRLPSRAPRRHSDGARRRRPVVGARAAASSRSSG